MKIREVVKKLEESRVFKEWKQKNKDTYFADAFRVLDANAEQPWQLGYYNRKDDKVTVFKMQEPIEVSQPDEVMKSEKSKVLEINIKELKVEMDEALKKSIDYLRIKHPKEVAIKSIIILQNLESVLLWNITHITSNYNALNIRIDAANGKVIEHKLIPLFEFQKKEEK